MKKFLIIVLTILFQFPIILWAQPLYVITKENALREYPKFFAPVKAFLRYGDILEPIRKENDWYFVKFRNLTGYVHNTALEKELLLHLVLLVQLQLLLKERLPLQERALILKLRGLTETDIPNLDMTLLIKLRDTLFPIEI